MYSTRRQFSGIWRIFGYCFLLMIKVFFHFLIVKLEGKIRIIEISTHARHMGNFTETRGLRVFYSRKTLNLPCDVYVYTGHEQVYRRAIQNYFNTCRNSLGIKRGVQNIQSDIHSKTTFYVGLFRQSSMCEVVL